MAINAIQAMIFFKVFLLFHYVYDSIHVYYITSEHIEDNMIHHKKYLIVIHKRDDYDMYRLSLSQCEYNGLISPP